MTASGQDFQSMPNAEYAFSREDFAAIAAFSREHFGISLTENKAPLVYSRLAGRLRARGIADFADYRRLLRDPSETDERDAVLGALTTNVTRFFREPHHFEHLRTQVLSGLVPRARNGGRVRLWSAGCSTGQEPYSIAACVLEACPEAADLDIRILATDIDPQVVSHGMRGRYSQEDARSIPATGQTRLLQTGDDGLKIAPAIRKLVTFGVLNLIEPLPFSGPFQVVFCRNVAIYFDRETQASVWTAFDSVLEPGGHLYIGHSERLSGPASRKMTPVGLTTYRKDGVAEATSPERTSR